MSFLQYDIILQGLIQNAFSRFERLKKYFHGSHHTVVTIEAGNLQKPVVLEKQNVLERLSGPIQENNL